MSLCQPGVSPNPALPKGLLYPPCHSSLLPPHPVIPTLCLLLQWGRDVGVREGPLDELHLFLLDLPAKCNPGPQKLGPGHDFWTLSCSLEVTTPPSVLADKEYPEGSRIRDRGVEGNAHRNFGIEAFGEVYFLGVLGRHTSRFLHTLGLL